MLQIIMLVCGIILLISPKSLYKTEKLKPGQSIESEQKKTRKVGLALVIITIILIILDFL